MPCTVLRKIKRVDDRAGTPVPIESEGCTIADRHWKERGWLMSIRPDLQVPVATAQAIVDGVLVGHTVAAVSKIHGGEIAATYEIAFGDAKPPVVLKVYPDPLHWKMQKEVTVASPIQARLSVPVPRILLADDSKTLLGLNFILMTKLAGSSCGCLYRVHGQLLLVVLVVEVKDLGKRASGCG
jgi:hypothetical protein